MSCFSLSRWTIFTQKPEDWPKPLFKALTYIYINFFSPTKSWVRNIEDNPKRDCQLPGREDGQIWRALDGGGGEWECGCGGRGKGAVAKDGSWQVHFTVWCHRKQRYIPASTIPAARRTNDGGFAEMST